MTGPSNAPRVEYRVTRRRDGGHAPWQWRCQVLVITGPMTRTCTGSGIARTASAAEEAAEAHLAAAHPDHEEPTR